jgi:hypothetical protein
MRGRLVRHVLFRLGMMKRAMCGVVAAVVGVGVVSSGCSTPGGRFAGGIASTITGGALIVAVRENPPTCPAGDSLCIKKGLDTLGYAVGGVLVAVGVALLIPDMQAGSKNPPAAATTVPGAASAARRPIAPDREVAAAASPEHPDRDAGPPSQLAVQLGIAAHAGRCQSAVALAHRLIEIDAAAMYVLLQHDAEVARCVGYRM